MKFISRASKNPKAKIGERHGEALLSRGNPEGFIDRMDATGNHSTRMCSSSFVTLGKMYKSAVTSAKEKAQWKLGNRL